MLCPPDAPEDKGQGKQQLHPSRDAIGVADQHEQHERKQEQEPCCGAPVPPSSPGQSEQGDEPIERIDDGDPIAVVPPATPGKKRSQTVGALPVHEQVTGHSETDAKGDPPPSRTLVLFVSSPCSLWPGEDGGT